MSDDTPLPPPPPPVVPAPEPSALKSILNPIQSGAATPSSTIVEAPRSPQPPPQTVAPSAAGSEIVETNGSVTAPADGPSTAGPIEAPVPVALQNGGDASLPPLPADAPVPPSPKAADEPPPSLPASAIPSAVPTPTVITDGALATPTESTPQPPALPSPIPPPAPTEPPLAETAPALPVDPPATNESAPSLLPETATSAPPNPKPASTVDAPSGIAEPAPTPVEATPAPTVPPTAPPVQEPMEVDPVVSSPASGFKRSGDELEGREEKRPKEEVLAPAEATPVPPTPASETPAVEAASATAPAPVADPTPSSEPVAPAPAPAIAEPAAAAPVEAPAPAEGAAPSAGNGLIPIPPLPEPSGPTTPLTLVQHKHLLNAVRSLKKSKDSAPFLAPVDPIAFGIPHYPQFVTNPMDLGTVETKLIVSDPRGPPKDKSKMGKWDESKGKYGSVAEVVLDVRQIRWNTARFNGPEHVVTQMADRLDTMFNKALNNLPSEPPAVPAPPSAGPSAGPSGTHERRQSVSQVPPIRRSSEGTDRPKREIHPPPSKDLSYADAPRKPKRRNDPQVQWANRTLKSLETHVKTRDSVWAFLVPVETLINELQNYSNVIKKPMDLNIIHAKVDGGEYDDISQLNDDIELMINNALEFNQPSEKVHMDALALRQTWREKLQSMPPKVETRESSEDPLADPMYDDESDGDDDDAKIAEYQSQINELQGKIDALRSKQAKRKANKQKRPKKSGPSQSRKQSMVKASPGAGASNGHAKKPRKSKDVYRDDEEEEEEVNLTQTQKNDLATKIQTAPETILTKAISIIQREQDVGSDGEIELDIDSLPPHALRELYVLVCGPIKKVRKSNYVPTGKKPGRKPGGPRKSMNEAEEAERIARMEAQLQSFGSGGAGFGGGSGNKPAYGYGDDDSESSEEEDSDLE